MTGTVRLYLIDGEEPKTVTGFVTRTGGDWRLSQCGYPVLDAGIYSIVLDVKNRTHWKRLHGREANGSPLDGVHDTQVPILT